MSQILMVLDSLGEKFNFFNPLGFQAKSDFDHKTFKINSDSIRASEPYMKRSEGDSWSRNGIEFFDLVQRLLNQTLVCTLENYTSFSKGLSISTCDSYYWSNKRCSQMSVTIIKNNIHDCSLIVYY